MQEDEIVEFGKEERERERKKSPCSPTLASTQLVPISSALPAWDLQESQRRCRVEKTRRQRFKRGVNIPVVFIRVTTWLFFSLSLFFSSRWTCNKLPGSMPIFFKKEKERRMHKRRVEKSGNPHASAQTILLAMSPWWTFRSVSMQPCSPNWSVQLGF